MLAYDMISLPIPFPPNSNLYVLNPQALNGVGKFFKTTLSPDGFWPYDPPPKGEFIPRCELTDHGTDPVFGVSLLLKITFREALKVENPSGDTQKRPLRDT